MRLPADPSDFCEGCDQRLSRCACRDRERQRRGWDDARTQRRIDDYDDRQRGTYA